MASIGFFGELPEPTDVHSGLVNILKSIIDGEWGPYDDAYYGEMADQAMAYLGIDVRSGLRRL